MPTRPRTRTACGICGRCSNGYPSTLSTARLDNHAAIRWPKPATAAEQAVCERIFKARIADVSIGQLKEEDKGRF
jgi:hypothetical protein